MCFLKIIMGFLRKEYFVIAYCFVHNLIIIIITLENDLIWFLNNSYFLVSLRITLKSEYGNC